MIDRVSGTCNTLSMRPGTVQLKRIVLAVVLYVQFTATAHASLSFGTSINGFHKASDNSVVERTNQSTWISSQGENVTYQSNNFTNSDRFTYCEKTPKFKIGSGSILVYLMRMKLCQLVTGRPWFDLACSERIYNVTSYYSAAYDKVCNPVYFALQCDLNNTIQHENTAFDDQAHKLVNTWMTLNRLSEVPTNNSRSIEPSVGVNLKGIEYKYCKSINSFFRTMETYIKLENSSSNNVTGDFHSPFSKLGFSEWFLSFRPFCEPVACGISRSEYDINPATSYNCFSAYCRPAIVFTMVLDSILAVVVVITNSLVLAVGIRTTIMQNIPGYFKMSLALADVMVGLFVLPGSVFNHYVLSMSPLPFRSEGQKPHPTDYFDQAYLNFMGVFTVISFSVSIYTMGAASVDRYLAITKPFRYRQGKYLTKKRSAIVFATIWSFGLICAIYPVFTKQQYSISALSLVLSVGTVAAVIYAVTMGLPLIAVWVINCMMLRQVCRDGKNRRTLSAKRKKNQAMRENAERTESNNSENMTKDIRVEVPNLAPTYTKKEQSAKRRVSEFAFNLHAKLRRQSRPSHPGTLSHENVEEKLAKTLAVMIGAFTMALLPSIVILALGVSLDKLIAPTIFPVTYSPFVTNIYTSAQFVASRLLLSNSFWNCIIYSVRNRHFRRALADVFICTEEARRRRRRSPSMGGYSSSSYRQHGQANRQRSLSKMASTDSSYAVSEAEKRRRSTHVWDLSHSTTKDNLAIGPGQVGQAILGANPGKCSAVGAK